jgi:CheY-like chemotaxis protein
MGADWKEISSLKGKDFLADPPEPNLSWRDRHTPAKQQPLVLEAIAQAITNRDVFELEYQEVRKDGGKGWAYSRAIAFLDQQGGISEWLRMASDIAGRREAQTASAVTDIRHDVTMEVMMTNVEIVSRRILIVDDNIDAADSLSLLLSECGHLVATNYDGSSAIERTLAFNPEVIFLDLGMPGMDGFETVRRIRRLPGAREIFIVALTGWGQDRDRLRTREAGFDHHLLKPVPFSEIQKLVSDAEFLVNRSLEMDCEVSFDGSNQVDEASSAKVIQPMRAMSDAEGCQYSKLAHDLANSFFGIRMAVEVLKRLEISESTVRDKANRIVDSIGNDCQKGEEVTRAIRELLSGQSNEG